MKLVSDIELDDRLELVDAVDDDNDDNDDTDTDDEDEIELE